MKKLKIVNGSGEVSNPLHTQKKERMQRYFENNQLTKDHQNFVFEMVQCFEDNDREDLVRFLMTKPFVDIQIQMAEFIQKRKPETAAKLILKMMISQIVQLLKEVDDERDELGFQK